MQDFAATRARPAPGAADAPSAAKSRVGADAFRSLTARLRKEPYSPSPPVITVTPPDLDLPATPPPPPMPSLRELAAAAVPAAPEVVIAADSWPEAPSFDLPVAVAPEPQFEAPQLNGHVAAEIPSARFDTEPVSPPEASADFGFPSFPEFGDWSPAPVDTMAEAAPALEPVMQPASVWDSPPPVIPDAEWPTLQPAIEAMDAQLDAPLAPAGVFAPDAEINVPPVVLTEAEIAAPPAMAAVVESRPEPAEPAQGEVAFHVSAPSVEVAVEVSPAVAAPRGPSPLADKIVDALVKTVTEAVYARPSAAERAAFLREVAELVERDELESTPAEPAPTPSPAPREVLAAAPAVAEPAISISAPSPILRKPEAADPFAAGAATRLKPAAPAELPEADEDTGELALSLLDMMAGGSAASQPQERALAADTLLRLVAKIPVRQLLAISERVAMMEAPPPLLVAKLIRDPRPEIAAPLLERCALISDHDLMLAAVEGDVHKQRMLARRRVLSPVLADQLIARADASVLLTLVRNPGVSLNHDAFYKLAHLAVNHEALLAPLTTRADLPAPVAFELFWHVPQELRRFIFSRFLTDSENLNKILKITLAMQATGDGATGAEKPFPPREAVDEAVAEFVRGKLDAAAQRLGEMAGIAAETAMRVLVDREGEPLAVLMKALGYPRSKFGEALEVLQKGEVQTIRPDRKLDEIQTIFDTLSFNKARILLTYWDWFICKSGPYALQH